MVWIFDSLPLVEQTHWVYRITSEDLVFYSQDRAQIVEKIMRFLQQSSIPVHIYAVVTETGGIMALFISRSFAIYVGVLHIVIASLSRDICEEIADIVRSVVGNRIRVSIAKLERREATENMEKMAEDNIVLRRVTNTFCWGGYALLACPRLQVQG